MFEIADIKCQTINEIGQGEEKIKDVMKSRR